MLTQDMGEDRRDPVCLFHVANQSHSVSVVTLNSFSRIISEELYFRLAKPKGKTNVIQKL